MTNILGEEINIKGDQPPLGTVGWQWNNPGAALQVRFIFLIIFMSFLFVSLFDLKLSTSSVGLMPTAISHI